MPVRINRFLVLFLCACSSVVLALTGCCKKCEGDACTPRSAWQSPTIQATRTLLLVNRQALRIVLIDGDKVYPTCVSESGVREYHLYPGEHTVTAVFRYDEPPSEGMLANVQGQPLTARRTFRAGRAYVAFYREHPGPTPELEFGVADVATNVLNPPQLHWSLEIADLAEAETEPEVRDARAYNAWVLGEAELLGK